MTRRRLPLMLALAGVLIILASVVAAVVVRSSDTATLALGERPDVPVVVTGPGVLDAVDPEVTVRATAGDDEQVVLAIGRTSEVEAWLGGADHMQVTGLSSWEELTTEVVTGTPEAATPTDTPTGTGEEPAEEPSGLPDPAGSDLWVVETVSTGSAELSWSDSPGRWSLVAATDGTGPAPQIELEWGREISTPWLVPGIVVGVLALVAGVTMLVLDRLARREERRREAARTEGPAQPRSITDTDPGTGERLTRRQIRELEALDRAERARAAGDPLPPPVPLAPDDDAPAVATEDAPAVVVDDAATEPEPTAAEPVPEDPAPASATVADGDAADEAEPLEPALDEVEPEGPEPEPAELAPEEPAPDGSPDDDESYEPAPPSWRSVWGFGGTAGPGTPPTQPMDDDGEERR